MEDKNSTPEIVDTPVDTPADTPAEKTAPRSFRCISEPLDKRMIAISFLTAVIAVVIYHFAIVAVNHFCTPEEEAVYCKCHNAVSEEDENEGKKKEFRRGDRGAKGKKGFGRQMSPEMREKISKMSPEERREFFAKLRQKKGKGAPGRPQRPQKHQHHGNNAEPAPQE